MMTSPIAHAGIDRIRHPDHQQSTESTHVTNGFPSSLFVDHGHGDFKAKDFCGEGLDLVSFKEEATDTEEMAGVKRRMPHRWNEPVLLPTRRLQVCLLILISSLRLTTTDAFSTTSSMPRQLPATPTQLRMSSVVSSTSNKSSAAQWHRNRRREMLQKHPEIAKWEKTADSQSLGGSLLFLANFTLAFLSILCGRLSNWKWTLLLSIFPGSICSLWQLQILHDNLHGCLLDKSRQFYFGGKVPKKRLQQWILFWGSMPSIFGYYLYLQYGHMTHHSSVGNPEASNLQTIFESPAPNFEDGDVLFVAHRMKLKGGVGPRFKILGKDIVMSISNLGFQQWKTGKALWNMVVFATSFCYERLLLVVNDIVVALAGKNFFFSNKPPQFHRECAQYCRAAVAVRALLWWLGGSWHSLLFLYLAETLWSIPPHPASAMFVTNHGSQPNDKRIAASPSDACIPSSSTYAGKWYSFLTLGTNYHCEHHDFPTIPLQHLGKLRKVAPEYYREGTNDRLWPIVVRAFADPDYYACMNNVESIR